MNVFRHPARFVLLGVVLAFIVSATSAYAAPVSIGIRGVVNGLNDQAGLLSGKVAPGQVIEGVYTYDNAALPASPSSTQAWYGFSSSPFGMALFINGYHFRTDPANVQFGIQVHNDQGTTPQDEIGVYSSDNIFDIVPASVGSTYMVWVVIDASAALLTDTSLPIGPLDLSLWPVNGLQIQCDDSTHATAYRVMATITETWNAGTADPDTGVTIVYPPGIPPGDTTVTPAEPGHGAPTGFRIVGGGYFDISSTVVIPEGEYVLITIPYDPATVTVAEENLRLFHWKDPGGWEDITVSVDTVNNTITGRADSLSPFAIMEPFDGEPVATPASSPWSLVLSAGLGLGAVLAIRQRMRGGGVR